MSGLLVDIVVTTKNNASVLREALASIEKQVFSAYQCYVVDDCSTDDTVNMVERDFPAVHLIKANRRTGPSGNRNHAIALGSAPFIVTLDDDVVLTPDWLKEMVEFISFSPSIGSVGSQLRYWDQPGRLNGVGGVLGHDGVAGDLFFNTDLSEVIDVIGRPLRILYAYTAAMIMRREAFEKAGRFDPSYFYLAEDLDLGIRMYFRGYLVVYNPKAIAYHRYHTTARSLGPGHVSYLYHRNCLLTLVKNFSFPAIAIMLSGFCFRLLFRPVIALKVLGWHLLHLRKVLAWRSDLRKRRVVDETQILSFNSANLALRSRSSGLIQPQSKLKSWKRRLLKTPFRYCVSVGENLMNTQPGDSHSIHRYVDHIIFQVTNICNAHCKQCFVLDELNKDVYKNLSLQEVERFFRSLGRVRNIVLGGGEPFLRKDLDQICILLDQVSRPELITIPTNGAYPDIIFRQVKSILENTRVSLKISLSLDGPPEMHGKIRQVPGLFAKVKETYERLLFLYHIFMPRLSLQVNSTVFADNYDQFSELDYLVKEHFPLARFTFEAIRGHYDSNLAQPISDEMYKDLIESMRQSTEIDKDGSLELHGLALKTIRQRTQVVPCIGGANFIVLDFFGNLYPCEILPSLVNIRDIDYDFRRILDDLRWMGAVQDIQNAKCHCTHMCFLSASLDEVRTKGRKAALPSRMREAVQGASPSTANPDGTPAR